VAAAAPGTAARPAGAGLRKAYDATVLADVLAAVRAGAGASSKAAAAAGAAGDAGAAAPATATPSAGAPARRPVVVFDLDHTLFDGRGRTLQILLEWASTRPHADDAAARVRGLSAAQVAYRIEDTLRAAGVRDAAAVAEIKAFWADRFFSDDYAELDVPVPGAPAYVRSLHEAGAFVVYLTGRDAPGMLEGTLESLDEWEFPLGLVNTQLILKPRADLSDLEFKRDALEQVAALGDVVATFENEPRNLALMAERFPAAIAVFLDTDKNPDHVVPLPKGARMVPAYTPLAR